MIDNSKSYKKLFNGLLFFIPLSFFLYLDNIINILFDIQVSKPFFNIILGLFLGAGRKTRIALIILAFCFYMYYRERPIKELTLRVKTISHVLMLVTILLAIYIDNWFMFSLPLLLLSNIVFAGLCFISFRYVRDMYPFLTLSAFSSISKEQKEKDKRFPLDKEPVTEQLMFAIPANNGTKGFLNIENPFQGIAVVGGAGAGKTYSVLNPILRLLPAKKFAAFVYDVKFPEQTTVLYRAWKEAHDKGLTDVEFAVLNFSDLKKSNRANPLSKNVIIDLTYCQEYCATLLKNLNSEWIKKTDFWYEGSHSLTTACLWFLRENEPRLCSLPHLTSLLLSNLNDIVKLINNNPDCKEMINDLDNAIKQKSMNQVSGIESSVKGPFKKINTKPIFWVLSGDDFDFDLNNPEKPKILCVGNYLPLQDVLSPVISLMATVSIKFLNMQGKRHSAFVADEIPTLFVPRLEQLPATGRSNQVATILGFQDYSQNEDMFGKEKARVLNANLGNQFVGQVTDIPTAENISKYFGQDDFKKMSQNFSDTDSVGLSTQRQNVIEVKDITTQKRGHFNGKLSTGKLFSCNIIASGCTSKELLPVTKELLSDKDKLEIALNDNFRQIKSDIEGLFVKYKKIAKDEISNALIYDNKEFLSNAKDLNRLKIDAKGKIVIYKDYEFSFEDLGYTPGSAPKPQNGTPKTESLEDIQNKFFNN